MDPMVNIVKNRKRTGSANIQKAWFHKRGTVQTVKLSNKDRCKMKKKMDGGGDLYATVL